VIGVTAPTHHGAARSVAPGPDRAAGDEQGLLGSVVSPFVGAPVTYTFRATLSEAGRPDVPGILEVSLDED
jgi:hypothetical protein